METILILIVITLVFSVTVGLIIMNRDSVPEELMDEYEETLEEKKKLKRKISSNDTEGVITDDEII